MTVPALLRRRAEATPDGIAFCHRERDGRWAPTTWGELCREVMLLAGRMRALGLGKGDRLAIMGRTCRQWQIAELAGLAAGAVIVGIDPRTSTAERQQMLADVSALVSDRDVVDGRALRFTMRFDDLARPRADPPPPAALPVVEGKDPAALFYTSGTTGRPKGILYRHEQLRIAAAAIADATTGLEPGDTMLSWLPMSGLFQRMMSLMAIERGLTAYFVEDPTTIVSSLREVEPSFFFAVPRLYEKLWPEVRERGREAVSRRLKFMLTGSAPIPAWLLQGFHERGLLVLEAYGVSENVVPMSANTPMAYRFGSVGRPFPQNELRFAEDGEILVSGPGLFAGYYGENGSADGFTPDGFYLTGDCGALDADGFLFLVGRKRELIKTSTGRRISPARVEAAYRRATGVDEIVVIGNGRPYLVALVSATGPVDPALLRRELLACGEALPPHERIADFTLLEKPLSVEAGELTLSLKLRRNWIETRYADVIARLYEQARPPA